MNTEVDQKLTFQSESGQVVVEYTLLIAVIVTIMISVFGIIQERFVATENCGPGVLNPRCFIQRALDPSGDLTFKTYYIKK
jgi:hypothetical protein